MKKSIVKLNKHIFISLISLACSAFMVACEDKNDLNADLAETVNILVSGNDRFLNGQTEEVVLNIAFQETGSAKIEEVRWTKQLITLNGNSEVVDLDPLSGTEEVKFSAAEMFEDVPVNGQVLNEGDLLPGDYWKFNWLIIAEGGVEVSSLGYSEWFVEFSCPSDISGTYTTRSIASFGDGAGGSRDNLFNIPSVVNIEETGSPGIYTIDDMSFGLYPSVYRDARPKGRIEDICGFLTDLGDTDQYFDPFYIEGFVTGDSTLTINWRNDFGDNGEVSLQLREKN